MHIRVYCAVFVGFSTLFLPQLSSAADSQSRFVFINFDQAASSKLGDFPSRTTMAKVVAKISEAAPKAIALKFFYDSPGVEADTDQLAIAISSRGAKANVILQATINTGPPTSTQLDERFYFAGATASIKPEISGVEGWLPIKKLAQRAHKVCFVDVVTADRVPMLETFQTKRVKSMYACLLEEAFGGNTMVLKNGSAQFGEHQLTIDGTGSVFVKLDNLALPPAISALDLLEGRVPKQALAGKVAVVIYTGAKSPVITVGRTSVKTHQVFAVQVRALEAKMVPVKK